MTDKKPSSSERRKMTRQASYARCQARKEARAAAQKEREGLNKLLRAEGSPTPHEANLLKNKQNRDPNKRTVRNDVGNKIVSRTVVDEHGPVIISGLAPCCSAKSYYKCKCSNKLSALQPRKFLQSLV
jgi:hypothetical protein